MKTPPTEHPLFQWFIYIITLFDCNARENMDYTKILQKLLTKQELSKYNIDLSDENIFDFLSEHEIYKTYDWKEEDVEVGLVSFLSNRANLLLGKSNFEFDNYTQRFMKEHQDYNNGDILNYLLHHYNNKLMKIGGQILLLFFYDDTYRIFVVKDTDASFLRQIESDFWRFVDVK